MLGSSIKRCQPEEIEMSKVSEKVYIYLEIKMREMS